MRQFILALLFSSVIKHAVCVHGNSSELLDFALSVYEQFCPTAQTCPVGRLGGLGVGKTTCCGTCSCWEGCFQYDTCCPYMYLDYDKPEALEQHTKYSCVRPQYLHYLHTNEHSQYAYWMVSECDDDFNSVNHEALLCAKGKGTLADTIPVTGKDGITYKNKHCAVCNFISDSDMEIWNIEIHCDGVPQISYKSEEAFIESIRDSDCNLVYIPIGSPVICFNNDRYTVSSCNVTGLWDFYDDTIERACNAFTDLYNVTYRNVFCYMCNVPSDQQVDAVCTKKYFDVSVVAPPFSALIGLDRFETSNKRSDNTECEAGKYFDRLKLVCRQLTCESLWGLQGESCVPLFNTVSNYCFYGFITLTPTSGFTEADIPTFNKALLTQIIAVLEYDTQLPVVDSYRVFLDKSKDGNFHSIVIKIKFDFLNPRNTYDFLNQVSNIKRDGEEISIVINGKNESFLFQWALFNETTTGRPMVLNERGDEMHFLTVGRDVENACFRQLVNGVHELQLTYLLTCAQIKLGLDEYRINFTAYGINIAELGMTLSHTEFRMENGFVSLCLNDFKIYVEKLTEVQIDSVNTTPSVKAKNILGLVCTSGSMLCLLITLFTYCLFSELQTQPGKNNVALSFTLLCAQCVYQFGAGQSQATYWVCASFGIASHFLWLSSLFWMNICSIHMFRVFCYLNKNLTKGGMKTTLVYLVYCWVGPAALVGLSIAVSVTAHGRGDVGYVGYGLCYLNHPLNVIWFFAVPVGLIVLINIALFSIVIFKISKSTQIKKESSRERSYFIVYAKLSSVTGLTWMFGIFYFFTGLEVIEYVFIILSASQGVYIMTAFIMNKRILQLFKTRLLRRKSIARSSQMRNSNVDKNAVKTDK